MEEKEQQQQQQKYKWPQNHIKDFIQKIFKKLQDIDQDKKVGQALIIQSLNDYSYKMYDKKVRKNNKSLRQPAINQFIFYMTICLQEEFQEQNLLNIFKYKIHKIADQFANIDIVSHLSSPIISQKIQFDKQIRKQLEDEFKDYEYGYPILCMLYLYQQNIISQIKNKNEYKNDITIYKEIQQIYNDLFKILNTETFATFILRSKPENRFSLKRNYKEEFVNNYTEQEQQLIELIKKKEIEKNNPEKMITYTRDTNIVDQITLRVKLNQNRSLYVTAHDTASEKQIKDLTCAKACWLLNFLNEEDWEKLKNE
ncbi:hypothetical protein PPERSA_00371 [Pseudocohnilembus persalinus]|uniref:Uncharacterized protein n=1 Tax=Pseudocohnilembus persalinus TaxID=266149 RepID=A0A0V0QYD8_PSEPJ|nr:hypothetical protein PPERSA_00371 [Pseudocohnilembus persalinus]|eukprot:KRX07214.1 hypothetical protein PPERSA_00371 [Pseudocohnilembus persalinus]